MAYFYCTDVQERFKYVGAPIPIGYLMVTGQMKVGIRRMNTTDLFNIAGI